MATDRTFAFITQGSIIQKFVIDSHNYVLGFYDANEYKHNPAYFGANIGRVANRVANARFSLNNKEYKLYVNNDPNSLHGGKIGWDQKTWTLDRSEAVSDKEGGWLDVYSLTSENGDENYPGTVKCEVKYLQYKEAFAGAEGGHKDVLEIEYEVKSIDGELDTVINLTNHSYFNLSPPSSNPSIDGTQVTLPTNLYLPVNQYQIPTTDPPAPFPNVAPNKPFTLTATEGPQIDHCFLLNANPATIPLDTRNLETKICTQAYHPLTRLWLEVSTTEPAFQFYTGDGIDVEARPDGSVKKTARAGFCVEPSRYIDAINRDDWKNSVVVKKGEVYGSRIVYKGWKGPELPHLPPNKPE